MGKKSRQKKLDNLYVWPMVMGTSQKPELLMPAGNAASFYAALEGGADAVYLGLKQFSARGRAYNFDLDELPSIVGIARGKGVKVYLALNTVVKNAELAEVARLIGFVSQCRVDAVIIQDWGVYCLARKFFPELVIHASTQMANHNSVGAIFSRQMGFGRVVLARELTQNELKTIALKSQIALEIFIHGALCYSFSGMCLFSSYIGGRGANRGMCAQPCRHSYSLENQPAPFFSLNDNNQTNNLEKLKEWGIASLKVEGRMKSADYVYNVAKAYRLALDHPEKIADVLQMLEMDFGRTKTEYFLGKDVAHAISGNTATGKPIGMVEKVGDGYFFFKPSVDIKPGFRIRVQAPGRDTRMNMAISGFRMENGLARIKAEKEIPSSGDLVYLTGTTEKRFPSELEPLPTRMNLPGVPSAKKMVDGLKFGKTGQNAEKLYLRINTPEWLKHIRVNDLDGLFLSFTKKGWTGFQSDSPFIQANREKMFVELPGFISEKSIDFYRDLLIALGKSGIKGCVASHLSQKLLVPEGWKIISGENIYSFNDAAIRAIIETGVSNVIYPLENDFENLKAGSHRDGIVPVYFFPKLFYSRMPVKIGGEGIFQNQDHKKFRHLKRDGMTLVIPGQPVSVIQNKKQLLAEGFHRFMIDLSFDNPSKNRYKTLITKFRNSELLQPSTGFNFKSGMK